jgi:hypothetical protein
MVRRIVLFALLVLVAAPCFGQVKLERKLKEGSTQVTEETIAFEQELSIAGMDVKTTVEAKSTTKSEIGQRDALGRTKSKNTIQALQVSINASGNDYTFDSANPNQTGNSAIEFLRDIHKAMLGSATTMTYENGKVTAIEHEKDIVGSLAEEVKPFVKSQFDPETLKKAANQELERFPAEPVKAGDSWQRTESQDVGSGQIFTSDVRYTYEGTVQHNGKPVEKITSKTQSVKLELSPDSPLAAQLMFKNSDLKPEESEGVILFDRERGIVVEEKGSVRIKGDITFAVGGQELPSKLDLKMRVGKTLKE